MEWFLLVILFALLIYSGGVGITRVLTWAECPRAGSIARLENSQRLVPIASDERIFEQATKAEEAQNESEINELLRSGKLFQVVNGTKVQILEVGWTKVKIKILEGSYTDRVGHVPIGWVKGKLRHCPRIM